jgi:hypothetical protein
MKNSKIWLGILAMALVFGMTVIGCDNGNGGGNNDSPLKGTTWVGVVVTIEEFTGDGDFFEEEVEGELKFTDNTFELFAQDFLGTRGNYSTTGSSITMTITSIHGSMYGLSSKWYNRSELETALKAIKAQLEMTDAEIVEELDFMFSQQTVPYNISGNTLSITMIMGETMTFTKK